MAVLEGVRATPMACDRRRVVRRASWRVGIGRAYNATVRSTWLSYLSAVICHARQVHAGKGGAEGIGITDGDGDLRVLEWTGLNS